MHFCRTISQGLMFAAAALVLTGCNPATKGWSASGGASVSTAHLIAVKQDCGYIRARKRAIRLLDAGGDRRNNRIRAARLMADAKRCMRKQGIHYRSGAYGIGQSNLR